MHWADAFIDTKATKIIDSQEGEKGKENKIDICGGHLLCQSALEQGTIT